MIMSILERQREIGIMKAIGAEDREIKLIFFVEAAVIGVTGGVLGTLLAWGIDAVANRLAYQVCSQTPGNHHHRQALYADDIWSFGAFFLRWWVRLLPRFTRLPARPY